MLNHYIEQDMGMIKHVKSERYLRPVCKGIAFNMWSHIWGLPPTERNM